LGDHFPPAIENVHTEIPMTNGMTVFLNSKESMLSLMFSESSEGIKPERAIAESSWPHHFASACASATTSTPPPNVGDTPLVPETTPIEGTPSVDLSDHVLTGIITQPPQL